MRKTLAFTRFCVHVCVCVDVCVCVREIIIIEWENTSVGVYFMSQEPGARSQVILFGLTVSEARPMMIIA